MELRGDFRRLELKFIKSFKYKHKREEPQTRTTNVCDLRGRRRRPANYYQLLLLSLLLITSGKLGKAFCPSKCVCNDQLLSANCTQVSSISIVPMTLNPLLKHMILNHLPIIELSNSLSVYRQLETLNLKSNLLKQISYQNFNFKPRHSSITIAATSQPTPKGSHNDPSGPESYAANLELNLHNQQLARHLKSTIDRYHNFDSASSSSQAGAGEEDEIGFHLRELDLSDNKIDLLGNLNELDLLAEPGGEQPEGGHFRRLKAAELERQAPFLTLARLEVLNLSQNRIQRLHRHVFLGLIRLKKLNLSKNYLEYVDKHAFVGLIELEMLDLSSNKLARQLGQLGLAFCRAPMNELKHLDLSDNQRAPTSGWLQQTAAGELATGSNNQIISPVSEDRDSILMLPNQMFICANKLIGLYLNGLQMRYIQVSAFDNLLNLESLNLSKNLLEQVPTDSFNYFGSNISRSLRQLDLSENLIEFVNVGSFERLENLQKLIMNRMPSLVSFDLGSLALTSPSINPYESFQLTSNHQQLINEHLIELQLKHNPRLQSVHSSLSLPEVATPTGSGRIISFRALREIQLEGNPELRELALEQMLDLRGSPLRIDLSYSSKLNCSSCQMGWLVEAARQQQPPRQGLYFQAQQPASNLLISDPMQIGCAWPYPMPLAQLLDLEFNFAAVFERCRHFRWAPPEQQEDSRVEPERFLNQSAGNQQLKEPESSLSLTLMSLLVVLITLLIVVKFALILTNNRSRAREKEFQWRSANCNQESYLSGSGSGSGTSPADCSSSSILSAAAAGQAAGLDRMGFVTSNNNNNQDHHQLMIFSKESGCFQSKLLAGQAGQIELAHGPGNLFSRIANQLSAWRPASGRPSGRPPGRKWERKLEERQPTMGPILEHIVYGGGGIFANNDDLASASHGYVVNSANINNNNNRLVYANCPEQPHQLGAMATCRPNYLAAGSEAAAKTQQQLTNLSPACLYSSGSASTASLGRQQSALQAQQHIYVTLDGPIKQPLPQADKEEEEQLYQRPQADQSASLSFDSAKSTNSHQDYKSFEWRPPELIRSFGLPGPLKAAQNNKFKLPDNSSSSNNNDAGPLSRRAFMGRAESGSGSGSASASRPDELSSSSSAAGERRARFDSACGSSRANRQLFMGSEENLNGSKFLPSLQLASTASFVATLSRGLALAERGQACPTGQLEQEPETSAGAASGRKYDANHDAVGLTTKPPTTTDDNDYVINGLPEAACLVAEAELVGGAWSDFRVGGPGGNVAGKRPPKPPEAGQMIGQQASMRHTSHHSPDYNNNQQQQQALKQTNNCDSRPGSIRGELANLASEQKEPGSRTNHNEIYTNQFYYCKPQSMATLSRTQLN